MKCDLYVDGSFRRSREGVGVYGGGAVAIVESVLDPIELKFAGAEEDLASMRNVAGELLAVLSSINVLTGHFPEIDEYHIIYDYEGIEKWVTGEWRAKADSTKVYMRVMRDLQMKYKITFEHVYSHTGVTFNERADVLAKKAVVDKILELGYTY